MGYAVRYRDASGATQLEDAASLEAALEQVERLRNEDGSSDVRVFREIPIEVKTYYKVVALEQDEGGSAGAPSTPADADRVGSVEPPPGAMPLAPPVATVRRDAPAPAVDDATDAAGDGRRSTLFSRG